ncbi:MAG: CPBP family intramembrane glutamic endopeptidase [Aliidongia sp.]
MDRLLLCCRLGVSQSATATAADLSSSEFGKPVRIVGMLGIVILSLLLYLHLVPGFHNQLVIDHAVVKPHSARYSLWLDFDKTAAGLLILGLTYLPLRRTPHSLSLDAQRSILPFVITVSVLMALGVASDYIHWAPAWSPWFWVWAGSNLCFTCMAEEALFRGFLQHQLAMALPTRRSPVVALVTSAVLFGLFHFTGGWAYVGLATFAGIGYGYVFQRTQRLELSILAHFGLNATHFLLFTYPSFGHS